MGHMDETKRKFLEMLSSFQKICDKIRFPGISRSEFVMMHTIFVNSDGDRGIKISDLAGHLQISTPAVSRMVKGLADKGFVLRKRDKDDKRITYVSLTEIGNQKRQECTERMREIGENTLNIMGQKDMMELIRLNEKLFCCLEKEIDQL